MGILVIQGPNGPLAFDDGGRHGSGVPRYYGRSFQGFERPTPVGARYFGPPEEADYGPDDTQIPIAIGDIYSGGREAYQEKVYQAAKKNPAIVGLKPNEVDTVLKPKVVAQ